MTITVSTRRRRRRLGKGVHRKTTARKIISMAQLYELGYTLREIGEYFGCSHEWVRQLLITRSTISLRAPGSTQTPRARP